MQVQAKLRHLRISPRKVRLVTEVIKGLDIESADQQLTFLNKASAPAIKKLLASAVANATNNNKLDKKTLKVKNIFVDEGFTLKRWKPRAMGRATMIRKRSSHVTLILEGKKAAVKKAPAKKTAKKETKKNTKKKTAKK